MKEPRLNTNFRHRLCYLEGDGIDFADQVIDAIGLMADRAAGILSLLAETKADNDSSEIWALFAALYEVKDISALIGEYDLYGTKKEMVGKPKEAR